jgi:hypothetical protein
VKDENVKRKEINFFGSNTKRKRDWIVNYIKMVVWRGEKANKWL